MTLYMHTAMMFVPATLGLLFMSWLMYTVLKKNFRKNYLFLHMILKKFSSRKLPSTKGNNSVDTKQNGQDSC